MKFDIGTFIFQVINFVVLLFILKRLLYRPVREMLQRRRDLVEETMRSAEEARNEALALKERHRSEVELLQGEHEQMLQKMKEEAFEERKRLLADAQQEAAALIGREQALFEGEKSRFEAELKDQAVEAAAMFSSRMLRDIVDEELHRGIWRKFLDQLESLAADLGGRCASKDPVEMDLRTAFDLSDAALQELRAVLEENLSRKVTLNVTTSEDLIAGVVLRACDLVYDFSLSGQVEDLRRRLQGGD